jgi:hypothetical protein
MAYPSVYGCRLVNPEVADIFKGVLESWNRSKSEKRFAEMRWAKNMRARVYHGRIKHIPAVGDANASLTGTLLQGTCESGRHPAMESGQDF